MLTFSSLCCRLFSLTLPLLVASANATDLELIRSTAEHYVKAHTSVPEGARAQIEARALDNRLQYPLCSTPLVASTANNQGSGRYISVKISCLEPQAWATYVPVQTRFEYPVVVAAVTLTPNTRLTLNQLSIEYKDANQLRGDPTLTIAPLLGARVLRRVNAGQPIVQRNVCLVCNNDPVTIVARSAGMEIKTNGHARSNGNLGDSIKVENQRSKRIVDAVVTGLAQTEVRL